MPRNGIYKYLLPFLLLMRTGVKGSTSSKSKDFEEDEEGAPPTDFYRRHNTLVEKSHPRDHNTICMGKLKC